MDKKDRFWISPLYMSLSFSNDTEDRRTRVDKKEGDWHHYGLFHRVANMLCDECRFEPSDTPYPELTVCQYPDLWSDHRWGGNQYLRFEGNKYPAGFKFEFWYQDSRTGNRNGGAYDITQGEYATNLERIVFRRAANKFRALLLSLGYEERGDEDRLKGRAWVMWKLTEDPGRHWGKWEDYRDEPYFRNYNGLDRDQKTIENGQIKYFRNWKGQIMRGQVYHNINNMWWVVLNEFEYTNIANFELFDPTPEDLAVRRLARDRANEEQKVRRKIGTKRYYELKALGIDMKLKEAES